MSLIKCYYSSLLNKKKKGINCSHNGNDSRKSGEEKINRGALEPEKEKDPFILCA